ncbi:MAG: DUF4974 domain-containing protein [Tannerella sp.]|jgi:ferric-dicitrate binding protein FerR (iron transport regulator)|nr:DUF4974 domain-containing protein [Tannerella sp.]
MTKHIPWDLLISHLKKETDTEQEAALTQWRDTGENDMLYGEIVSLWDEIRRESSSYNPDRDYFWKQLEARMRGTKKKRRLSVSLHAVRAAVAAAAVLLFIVFAAAYRFGETRSKPETNLHTCTAVNGKTQVVLPDGSLVWLNVGSTLTYETPFLHNREVTLDGEALFDVRKDDRRLFTVRADEVRVEVFGTRFNVHAYPAEADIRVALLDGSVNMSAGERTLAMTPGKIASFDRTTRQLSTVNDDIAVEACWAGNACSFEAQSLSHICRYLERWYNVDIRLDASIAETQTYTFTITDEPLETVLRIMSRINPIRYSFGEDRTVTIRNVKLTKK